MDDHDIDRIHKQIRTQRPVGLIFGFPLFLFPFFFFKKKKPLLLHVTSVFIGSDSNIRMFSDSKRMFTTGFCLQHMPRDFMLFPCR